MSDLPTITLSGARGEEWERVLGTRILYIRTVSPETLSLANDPDTPCVFLDLDALTGHRILQALIANRGGSLSREELAHKAGASSSSSAYMNNLGALRSLGLIDYPRQGQVQAEKILFLEGE